MATENTRTAKSAEFVDQEYISNRYMIKCFGITMLVFTLTFLLNVLGIFTIEQSLMTSAYVPSMAVYLLTCFTAKFVPLSNRKLKYFFLFTLALIFTITGIFLTYHVVLVPILLFLCATMYSSKYVMRYTYVLTVLSTLVTVYGGYYFGLCDANMALLTSTRLQNYVLNGHFTQTMVNTSPMVSLFLFFFLPRCLIYIAFSSVCSSIFNIVAANAERAQQAAELERFQIELKRKVDEQTEEIRSHQKKMEDLFVQTITALSEAVDAKDRYTSGHSKRVARYSSMIAQRLGKTQQEQEAIYRAGLLHDMGKIRVPAEIINKPGKLTEEEYNIIKIHPATGYHILRGIAEDNSIAVAAKYHHERYDGNGYPNGLSGENIPEIARIIGIADAYDAMASNRSYRSALPQDVVRSEFEKYRGSQFDPRIADIMLQMIDEDTEYTMKQPETVRRRILTVAPGTESSSVIAGIMSGEPMYEVISAESEAEALDLLSRQHINLVMLDLGSEKTAASYALRTIRRTYQVPVVLMIDTTEMDISSMLSEYDCDDYLTKPLLPLLVKEIVYNVTKHSDREA